MLIVFVPVQYCILAGCRHGRPAGGPQHEPRLQEPPAAAAHGSAAATATAAAGKIMSLLLTLSNQLIHPLLV